MKKEFNFLHYYLVFVCCVSIGMFIKDLIYFLILNYKFKGSLEYFNIIMSGAFLYKFDLLIAVVCIGFLLIENYLNPKELKGGIENGN